MQDVTSSASGRKRTADELAAHFQKAEPRWEKRRKRRKGASHFTLAWRRRRELQIILQHRYPDGIPDHIDIDVLVWVDKQVLGDSFGLTAKERTMWGITTIRPCDRTIDDMRRERNREGERVRRKAKGAVSRKQYLATNTKSRLEPWKVQGISRRTYYRRMAQLRGVAQLRGDHLSNNGVHAPVPSDSPQDRAASLSPTTRSSKPIPVAVPWKWTPDGPPVYTSLGYLIRLNEYRRLTSGAAVRPGEQAARSELRRVAA